jgi:hypothetical protein
MSFLKKLFGKAAAETPVQPEAFWDWFAKEAARLKATVVQRTQSEQALNEIMEHLQAVNPGLYTLVGAGGDGDAELIISAEGRISQIVFVEEMVAQAPKVPGWKFTALKPAIGFSDMRISIHGFDFEASNIHFFANESAAEPDSVDISFVYDHYNPEKHAEIENGLLIYLDNALGEMNFMTQVDHAALVADADGNRLIPVEKLPAYLQWREKEFIEKYDAIRYSNEEDSYGVMEAKDEESRPMIAIVNSSLMRWEGKTSHPWMVVIEIKYEGDAAGLPQGKVYEIMNEMEDELAGVLTPENGCLNIGRETYNNSRNIYFACHEFRESSRKVNATLQQYKDRLKVSYQVYKDKYWQIVSHFMHSDV